MKTNVAEWLKSNLEKPLGLSPINRTRFYEDLGGLVNDDAMLSSAQLSRLNEERVDLELQWFGLNRSERFQFLLQIATYLNSCC
ncbi:MAG: hypothetical protein WDN10_05430 [bacterium]